MTSPFTALVQEESSQVKPADLQGHLLIIKPIEYIESIITKIGESEAVALELIDLDTNEHFAKVLFFNKVLVSALKPNIGKSVLARLGQGVAKPGKSAPWILVDATTDAEAVAKATAYLANGLAPVNEMVDGVEITPEIAALVKKLGAKPA